MIWGPLARDFLIEVSALAKTKMRDQWNIKLFIGSSPSFYKTSGPLLPTPLRRHSMVRLGKGQAILGGSNNGVYQTKIYSMTCSNRNCTISLLDRELSVPKGHFVAIPIPDTISGCITGGKNHFQKNPTRSIKANICFTPQI